MYAARGIIVMPMPRMSWNRACRFTSSNGYWVIATSSRRCATCTGCRVSRGRVRAMPMWWPHWRWGMTETATLQQVFIRHAAHGEEMLHCLLGSGSALVMRTALPYT